MSQVRIVCAFIAACLPLAPLRAGVVELHPAKDNTLIEIEDGSLSNGAGGGIFCGRTAQDRGLSLRRALLAFDIAGNIPAGSAITSVDLQLSLTDAIEGEFLCTLHRALQDWGEGASDAGQKFGGAGVPAEPGDATWLHTSFDAMFWRGVGGDFDVTPHASTIVGVDEVHIWGPTDELTADVQSWLDDPATNFGWLLKGAEDQPATAKRFGSREALEKSLRPVLTIEFVPPMTTCVADLDESGDVGPADLAQILGRWGACERCQPDLNGDGVVGPEDLSLLLDAWGRCR